MFCVNPTGHGAPTWCDWDSQHQLPWSSGLRTQTELAHRLWASSLQTADVGLLGRCGWEPAPRNAFVSVCLHAPSGLCFSGERGLIDPCLSVPPTAAYAFILKTTSLSQAFLGCSISVKKNRRKEKHLEGRDDKYVKKAKLSHKSPADLCLCLIGQDHVTSPLSPQQSLGNTVFS